jgi:hypothetical protein
MGTAAPAGTAGATATAYDASVTVVVNAEAALVTASALNPATSIASDVKAFLVADSSGGVSTADQASGQLSSVTADTTMVATGIRE